jgi:biotin carboxylase
MKRALARCGIPMTDFVDGNLAGDLHRLGRELGVPLVVKARRGSGGRGLVFVDPACGDLPSTRNRIVERFVDAAEVSVESFVHDGRVVFENATQYYRKGHVNVMPAAEDGARAARALSRRVVAALGIRWGISHVEVYLARGGLLFGEIALRPPGGYLMELLPLAYGFDAWSALVAVELGEPFEFPGQPIAAAASIVLHPGAGQLRGIRGLAAVRAHPAVVRVRMRVRAGDRIAPRSGLGADVGHIVLRAPDRARLLAAIDEIDDRLRFDLEPASGA